MGSWLDRAYRGIVGDHRTQQDELHADLARRAAEAETKRAQQTRSGGKSDQPTAAEAERLRATEAAHQFTRGVDRARQAAQVGSDLDEALENAGRVSKDIERGKVTDPKKVARFWAAVDKTDKAQKASDDAKKLHKKLDRRLEEAEASGNKGKARKLSSQLNDADKKAAASSAAAKDAAKKLLPWWARSEVDPERATVRGILDLDPSQPVRTITDVTSVQPATSEPPAAGTELPTDTKDAANLGTSTPAVTEQPTGVLDGPPPIEDLRLNGPTKAWFVGPFAPGSRATRSGTVGKVIGVQIPNPDASEQAPRPGIRGETGNSPAAAERA